MPLHPARRGLQAACRLRSTWLLVLVAAAAGSGCGPNDDTPFHPQPPGLDDPPLDREMFMTEVLPVLDRLESKDWLLSRQLLLRCGELGLLGVDAPEAYDGLHLDKTTSMVVASRSPAAPIRSSTTTGRPTKSRSRIRPAVFSS